MALKGVIIPVSNARIEIEIVPERLVEKPIKAHFGHNIIKVGPDMEHYSAIGLGN